MRSVCEAVAPTALIGVSHFEGEHCAEQLCAIAASQLSVRFVLGFGPELPDGVASLDDALAAGPSGPRYSGANVGRGPAMRPGMTWFVKPPASRLGRS
jgi:hypothetical protein